MKVREIVSKMEELAENARSYYDGGCYDRAQILGRMIRASSRPGEVQMVMIKNSRGGFIHPDSLFSNDGDWNHHYAIFYRNRIWDPLVGRPLKKEPYLKQMFPNQGNLMIEESGPSFY